MIYFKNDYSEGCHPSILRSIVESNYVQMDGYSEDVFCIEAAQLIKQQLKDNSVDIHFLAGGTITNLISISAFLRPYEACISCAEGHIATHETGAIEACGHKVLTVQRNNAKLDIEGIKEILELHTDEHMVIPKLIYLTNATEHGTIYYLDELKAIYKFAQENDLYVYLDGARLSSALNASDNDVTLNDLVKYTDAFYIGATKNGGLLGEALVISNDKLKPNFRYNIKQKGGLLAKGRLMGVQFKEMFKDNLFNELGLHANKLADLMREELSKHYDYLVDTTTNQIFPILPNDHIKQLEENFLFYVWSKVDENHSSIRLITSFATKKESVQAFIKEVQRINNK